MSKDGGAMTSEETRKVYFARDVTNNMAREAFRQYHQALYHSGKKPCLSIPVDPSDADVVLGDYLRQQAERESELASARREIAGLKEALQTIRNNARLCDGPCKWDHAKTFQEIVKLAERVLSGDKDGANDNPFEPPETPEQQDRRVGKMIRDNADKKRAAAYKHISGDKDGQ